MTPSIDTIMMDDDYVPKNKRKRCSDDDPEEEARALEYCGLQFEGFDRYRQLLRQHYDILIPPRLQFSSWKHLSTAAKEQIALCIQDVRNIEFVALDSHDLPLFKKGSIHFILIPGGNFVMGFSEALEEQLCNLMVETFRSPYNMDPILESTNHHGTAFQSTRQMRPTQRVSIQPFLLATTPMTYGQVQQYLPHFPAPNNNNNNNSSIAPLTKEQQNHVGVCLSESQMHSIFQNQANNHHHHHHHSGLRLPSEAEWEYAARGGGWDLLFPYQCRIPTREDKVWLLDEKNVPKNAFGLYGVGSFPELCADGWHETLEGLPRDGSPRRAVSSPITRGRRVVRGVSSCSCGECGGRDKWGNMLVYQRHPQQLDGKSSLRLAMDILPNSTTRKNGNSV